MIRCDEGHWFALPILHVNFASSAWASWHSTAASFLTLMEDTVRFVCGIGYLLPLPEK